MRRRREQRALRHLPADRRVPRAGGLRGRPLIVDTSALYALVDEADAHHARAEALLVHAPGPLVVPVLVVGEAGHLIQRRLGPRAEALFLATIAEGDLVVADVPPLEWLRVGELVSGYRDLPLGTVDASVVATAERLGVTEVATTDRRHFTVVRPRHCDAFALPLLD